MALGNIIESFFVYLGFEVGTDELEEWFGKVEEAESVAAGIGVALVAASAAVFGFVNEMAEGAAKLKEFADVNSLNYEELQKNMYAANAAGSSADAMKEAYASLNNTMGALAQGLPTRAGRAFKLLGLDVKDATGHLKSVGDMMSEVLEKAAAKGQSGAGILRRLGFDPSLILLAKQGKEGIEALRQEAERFGVVSDEDAERSIALTKEWKKIKAVAMALGMNIAMKLVPGVLSLVSSWEKWIVGNKEWISARVVAVVEELNIVVGHLWTWVSALVGVVMDVVKWLLSFKLVSAALLTVLISIVTYGIAEFFAGLAVKILSAATAMLKFDGAAEALPLLIGLLAAAVFLLTDDLWNYFKGNNSVIGQLKEKYPHAVGIAIGVLGLLSLALSYAAAVMLGPVVSGIFAFIAAGASMIGTIVSMTIAAWNFAAANIAATWEILLIVAAIGLAIFAGYELYKHWGTVTGGIKKMWSEVTAEVSKVWNIIKSIAESKAFRVVAGLGTGGASELAYGGIAAARGTSYADPFRQKGVLGNTSSMASHSSTTTVHAPITINTNDPEKAGASAADHVKDLSQNTTRNGQSPVSH
jgi:hypothetical protein